MRRLLAITLLAVVLPLATIGDEPKKPAPKLPLGKDTTYVTGPVDNDGYIDYEAALNERLGKGITPEKNANVLIWKALGPRPEGGRMPAEFFKRLGVAEPPAEGEYFIGFFRFVKEHLRLDEPTRRIVEHHQAASMRRPWTADDYPPLAAWLKFNDKPLAVIHEAVRRPDYFNPLVSASKGRGALMAALLPGVQKCREVAAALACRAMLRTAEGKYDAAWQDLQACHHLGRHLARGGTMIESLVGFAIDRTAADADVAFAAGATLTAKQLRHCLRDLQALPPMAPVADKFDLAERLTGLDMLQAVTVGGTSVLEALSGSKAKEIEGWEILALANADWAPAFRNMNRWHDRLLAAMRLEDRAERQRAFVKFEEDFLAFKQRVIAESPAALARAKRGVRDKNLGEIYGDLLIGLIVPSSIKVRIAQDRGEQIERNVHVAFALAAFRADHSKHPTKLDELSPDYLAAVPGDLFSGKALIYKPAERGYLLYSVGPDGTDDGGRTVDEMPPGDDLRVRVPVPELKQ